MVNCNLMVVEDEMAFSHLHITPELMTYHRPMRTAVRVNAVPRRVCGTKRGVSLTIVSAIL